MLFIIQGDDEQFQVFKAFNDLGEEDLREFLINIADRMESENLGWWDRSFSSNSYDSWPTPG